MEAPLPDPYGWAIEYRIGHLAEVHCCFIKNDGHHHDRAYVMNQATKLHGEIRTLVERPRSEK